MEGGCQEADGRFWGVFGDLQPDISGQSGRDLAEGLGGMGALGDDETPRRRNAVGLEIAGPLLWAFTGRDHGVGHHCGHAGTAEDATG
jgi:hypothetical protein